MYLYFNGVIPQDMKSFFINLQYSQMEGSDMALSINPQFEPAEAVMFSAFRNGTFETEHLVEKMPFTKGEAFELLILITADGYQVNANGCQLHFFPHCMPVEQVSVINMVGDISVQTLDMIQGGQGVLEGLGKLNVTQIPHIGPLYGGLRPGMALFFQGTVPEDVERFSIDLQYGQQAGSDIAFQFKPQFEPSEELVFNSFQNGSWGEAQKIEDVPFEPGDTFELAFIVMEEFYQVVLNGQRLCEFAHRMPVDQVSALQITGNVIIGKVSRIGGDEVEIIPEPEIIPDVEPVSEPLKMGRALVFKGTIPSTITNFTVNLRCGNTEDSDIAFHFNPQYEPNELVVLNTFQGGEWGQPESVDNNPFTKGESFELAYIFTETMYQVRVNGADFCEYKHRIPADQVNCVQIIGEVCMQTTTFVDAEELEPEEEEEVVNTVIPMTDSMKVGTTAFFRGTIPAKSKRFGINLMSGETDRAVDFNVQYEPSASAVFNSFQNGEWGEEQRVAVEHFQRGGDLIMGFSVVEGGYQFSAHGADLCLFSHRMPAENVTSIQITGDVDIPSYGIAVPMEPEEEIIQAVQKEVMVSEIWKIGTTLTIEGVVPEDARIFSIDLRCGDSEDSEIAFRFSPQFETSEVVFSTFQNRVWGTEEKVDQNPFTKGQQFVLVFLITEQGYLVTVNGAEFYTYPHHVPIEVHPSPTQLGTIQSETTVSEGLKMEMSLIFQGVIPEEITRFSINLLCGTEKDSDVAFHFAPQFETSEVVFNTYQNKTWETAEKVDKLPLTKGQPFTIVYIINEKGYQVNIDDAEFYFYAHRIEMESVKAVQICGDVIIKIAEVKEPVPEIPLPTRIAPVQCVTPLKKGCLKPGISLSFEGVMPAEITRFLLNLQCGESDDSDAAFDINLLFDTAEVVFNSIQGGKWQEAEKVTPMPFVKGEKFLLLLNIVEEGYEVFVNDENIHFFKHRISLEKVTCLQVIADASMILNYLIKHTEHKYPKPTQVGPVQSVTPMAGQLKSGMSLTFEGTIPENITCFCINLQCGEDEGCDTALHFSPQFSTNQVLFNSFRDGKWEVEERVTEMPFRKGECFVLLFIITADGYLVKVNGNELYMFKHRMAVEGVTGMQLIGDVNISTCKIVESAPSVTVLPQGLASGTHITFLGTAPPESDGFTIDLLCGCDECSDSAFQFKAEFKPGLASLFNTSQNGVWGEPEIYGLPIARGEEFEILFITTPDGYQVQIEGEDVTFYHHRVGLDQVKALRISGNVCMPAVNIIEGAGPWPTSCFDTVITAMPTVMPLAGALKTNTSMNFTIPIPKDIPSFTIDLACGDGPDADIALHLNAQFEPCASLGFNSFIFGRWDQEETITPMPFQRGTSYDLAFDISEEGYQVKVNDTEIHRYGHRIPVDQVQAMRIVGNINVQDVNIIERSMYTMPGDGTFMFDGEDQSWCGTQEHFQMMEQGQI
ncbi:hypothetical protein GJAV_G00052910 [Gymnothorax javanicus]|nr:hypothetical protein GJAV_G00052910 [Gymnothorax javanicus]